MKKEIAESIEELHVCPFCNFTNYQWSDIVRHMTEYHTDEEAREWINGEQRSDMKPRYNTWRFLKRKRQYYYWYDNKKLKMFIKNVLQIDDMKQRQKIRSDTK